MAFQQPTRQPTQRIFRPTEDDEPLHSPHPASSQDVHDSQTWVLFPPATDAGTTSSYLTSTHKTDATPGRSQLSELGSLNTVARSEVSALQPQSASVVDVADDDEEEEDAELDSLDSHLPDFRSTPYLHDSSHNHPYATPVVPAHDGLGSFRLEQEMGADVQDRLYAFEQYNPRRMRKRESLDLAQIDLEDDRTQEADKMRRIEAWRLEQSRYLLDKIQKETRRRRQSAASVPLPRRVEEKDADIASMSGVGDASDDKDQGQEWHDHDDSDLESEQEGIWGRITRKVVRDLMGIDDKLLCVLFGEALPDEEDLSSTPKASTMPPPQQDEDVAMENATGSGWQLKMLERVAKELGFLIHRLSEHPGTFSTFSRVQQMPIPYAGLPSIPESTNDAATNTRSKEAAPMSVPEFQPTIAAQTQPIDVPQPQQAHSSGQANAQMHPEKSTNDFTQDEWEQELDVRLVFRYLRSRFMSRSSSSSGVSGNHNLASSSAQDAAAKVARIRQHHPLTTRSRPAERRISKATIPSSPVFKKASSCASQSTRRSVRRSSASSSRHYWDIGGSVGTGSMIATTGPMGSWGEV
ncbi:hypothetical protein GGR52DRAFT_115013 [Hypoxylon sp. FL1284]|nr:hypothetical protein GGR52DRAFT_115013 [Hypoxylon sp. FL1284]